MQWSPRETTSILLEYVRSVAGPTHHTGISLATAQINKQFQLNPHNKHVPVSEGKNCKKRIFLMKIFQVSVHDGRSSCVKDHLSLLSSSHHHRTHHFGEVSGMLGAAAIITGVSPGNEEEAVDKLAVVFTSQLRDALRDGMGVWKNGRMINEGMYENGRMSV